MRERERSVQVSFKACESRKIALKHAKAASELQADFRPWNLEKQLLPLLLAHDAVASWLL